VLARTKAEPRRRFWHSRFLLNPCIPAALNASKKVVFVADAKKIEALLKKQTETIIRTQESVHRFGAEFRSEFRKQLLTLVTAAFGFTAALFWNTAIKDTVEHFVPQAESWYWEIAIAALVTVVSVFFIYAIAKLASSDSEKSEKTQ